MSGKRPTEDTNREEEIYYNEVCRRIDHQIEEKYKLEEQALSLLRIILATVGLLLTALSVIASTGSTSLTIPDVSFGDIQELAENVVDLIPFLREAQIELVSVVLVSILSYLAVSSVGHLFISVPRQAYKVLDPSFFHPSTNLWKQNNESEHEHRKSANLYDEYSEIISKNKEELESARRHWKQCYESLRTGTVNFGIFISFLLFSLILQSPIVTSLLLVAFIIVIARRTDPGQLYKDIDPYLRFNPRVHLPSVIISFSIYATESPVGITFSDGGFPDLILRIIGTASIIIILVEFISSSKDNLGNQTGRDILILTGLFSLMLFTELATGPGPSTSPLQEFLAILFVIYVMIVVAALAIIIVKEIWDTMRATSKIVMFIIRESFPKS